MTSYDLHMSVLLLLVVRVLFAVIAVAVFIYWYFLLPPSQPKVPTVPFWFTLTPSSAMSTMMKCIVSTWSSH